MDGPDPNLLDSVAEEATALVPAPRRAAVAALARAAYRREPELPPSAAQRVVAAFAFLDERKPGALAVRGFDPDLRADGYAAPGSVVEVSVEDRPLLLPTVTETLRAHGLRPAVLLHPVVVVDRGPDGHVRGIAEASGVGQRESLISVELDARLDAAVLAALVEQLRGDLDDALAASDDAAAMRAELDAAAGRLERAGDDEALALLRWLLADHFLVLGSCRYLPEAGGDAPVLVPQHGSGLGVLRRSDGLGCALLPVPEGELVAVARTARLSTVARRVRLTAVALGLDEGGDTGAAHVVVGLFTPRAYAEPASATPVLRRTLAAILAAEGIAEGSDDTRQLRALFDSFPKHELFAADPGQLRATLVALLAARRRQDTRVLATVDEVAGSASVLVALPRERFSPAVRHAVQDLLVRRFAATGFDYHLSLDDQGQALLSFALALDVELPGAAPASREALQQLEADVARLTRTFAEDLAEQLRAAGDAHQALRRSEEFVRRLPAGYTQTTNLVTAAQDLAAFEELADGEVRAALRASPDDEAGVLHLRVWRAGGALELSDFVPVLEHLGLTVIDQVAHRLCAEGGEPHFTAHDFAVRADRDLPPGVRVDIASDGPRLAAAVLAVLRGEADSDSLDRLVLVAGLDSADVDVLRAYRQYRRQVGTTFSPQLSDDTLVSNPTVAVALVEVFAARFDPWRAGDPAHAPDPARAPDTAQVHAARAGLDAALAEVTQFEQDRILRGFAALLDATLRTNRWAATRREALSLKFDSARVPGMPQPVPAVEVFVTGRGVQGVHLRGGPVARGGLRWSDRREDLRTEILGLLKAQMTKNALIVPTGAKGGFVLTRHSANPAVLAAQVRHGYETFVRGLLDLTDNVVDAEVVTPAGVRRWDGDDPYLVVAADRGTATFSDLANAVAQEYGFWLGDAFASGGSHGYDHKAMGITARGAWVAVRRHFRSLDIDVQTDPVSVVGIGDMSGDVFGNGVLLSSAIRLVAAFDHRHIFLDPLGDPATGHAERTRLAALPRSSWADYDPAALGEGGEVWSRSGTTVPLSAPVQALLRMDVEALAPPDLIRALLRAPVDLLFAGGIGTFVRSSTETDAEVGDRANDAVRVAADELGARVVGEGGNLALTQRARIQYARRGGRCNTDAIDNAGGVNTSDREVNLKILLALAADEGQLDPAERDGLLAAMTGEVADAVLSDVDRQIAALDWEVDASPALLAAYEGLMAELSEQGRLVREVEALPGSDELRRRAEVRAGFTRPELAVLLGYAKTAHADALLASDLPDDPHLLPALRHYFPPLAVERFGALLGRHRLRRQLVATVVANDLVNHMGVTYPSRTARELGCTHAEIAAAWWAACEVTDAWSKWAGVEALGERVTPALQVELAGEVDALVDTLTRSYVRSAGKGLARVVARDRPAFLELAGILVGIGEEAMPRVRRAERAGRVARWMDLGIDAGLAGALASLRELSVVPDVALVAAETGSAVRAVGEVLWRLSEALPFDELSARLTAAPVRGSWQSWQRRGLLDELRELRREAALLTVRAHPDATPDIAVARWLDERAAPRERTRGLLAALDRDDPGLDGVAVVVRSLRSGLR